MARWCMHLGGWRRRMVVEKRNKRGGKGILSVTRGEMLVRKGEYIIKAYPQRAHHPAPSSLYISIHTALSTSPPLPLSHPSQQTPWSRVLITCRLYFLQLPSKAVMSYPASHGHHPLSSRGTTGTETHHGRRQYQSMPAHLPPCAV
jgi:hypothetical protein